MAREDYFLKVEQTVSWLREKVAIKPKLIVVLSGGLDGFVAGLDEAVTFSYDDIPNFFASRTEGHAGKLIFGKWKGVPLVVMQGRQHYYDAHTAQDIVFPYFVFNKLGASMLVTTNAVGGVRHDLNAGDIMMVTDHINFMGDNPLIGIATQRKLNQFTSMINAYDDELRSIARGVAHNKRIELKEGVYISVTGPNYETPAEIRMVRSFGADAVGMSTVFEVLASRFLEMRVLAFCAIANPAADRHEGAMSHAEVLKVMKGMAPKLVSLLQGTVEEIGRV